MRRDSTSRTIYRTTFGGTTVTAVAKMGRRASDDSFVVNAHQRTVSWSDVQRNTIMTFDLDGRLRDTWSPPKLYQFIVDLVSASDRSPQYSNIRNGVHVSVVVPGRQLQFVQQFGAQQTSRAPIAYPKKTARLTSSAVAKSNGN